jgi:hypothetical protein
VDIDPAFGQRQRNPPSSHGEFEYGSGASVLGEEADGALRVEAENL